MKAILLIPFIVIFSCKSTLKSKESKAFPSGKYKVEFINNENYKPLADYLININTEENRIGGKFDCNSFSADYQKDGNTINFGYAMATKMYCDGKMDNENAFMSRLKNITSYTFNKEELIFYNEEDKEEIKLNYVDGE